MTVAVTTNRPTDQPTSRRISDCLQVPPDAQQASEQPDQGPEEDDHNHVERPEEFEVRQAGADGGPEQGEAAPAEQQRQETAEDALDGALEHEGSADEAVGGADEPHDGDLAGALEDRNANRHADDRDGDDRERESDGEPDNRREPAELIEPLDPLPP